MGANGLCSDNSHAVSGLEWLCSDNSQYNSGSGIGLVAGAESGPESNRDRRGVGVGLQYTWTEAG